MAEKEPNEQPSADGKPKKRPRSLWRRLLRWFLGFIFFLVFLLVGLQVVFYYYSDQIIGSVLKSIVENQSDGLYYLEYDQIRLDIANKKLEFKELHLRIDSTRLQEKLAAGEIEKGVAEVYIPYFLLEDAGISRFYFTQKMRLKQVLIENPEIHIGTMPRPPDEKVDLLKLPGLYPIFSDYLDLVSVQSFAVTDGLISINSLIDSIKRPTLTFQQINAVTSNLVIDERHQGEDNFPFACDGWEVDMADNVFPLAGDSLNLQVGHVRILTADSLVEVKRTTLSSHSANSYGESFRIDIPEYTLKGVNFPNWYLNRVMDIRQLRVEGSDSYFSRNSRKDSAEISLQGWHDPIKRYLDTLIIREILSTANNLTLVRPDDPQGKKYEFKSFLLQANNFQLDSASQGERYSKVYADGWEIILDNYKTSLPDSLHWLETGPIRISTLSREFSVNDIWIYPDQQANPSARQSLFELRFPVILGSGINFWKAIYDGELVINDLVMGDPVFSLYRPARVGGPVSHTFHLKNLYPLISKFLESLTVDRLSLENGTFDLSRDKSLENGRLKLDHVEIELSNFRLDANSYADRSKLFYADHFSAMIAEASMLLTDSLHEVKVKNLHASSNRSYFKADRFSVSPVVAPEDYPSLNKPTDGNLLDMQLKKLRVNGLNFKKAYYNQEFMVKEIKGQDPSFKVYGTTSKKVRKKPVDPDAKLEVPFISDYFQSVMVEECNLDNGLAEAFRNYDDSIPALTVDDISICLQDLELDTGFLRNNQVVFDARDLELDAGNYALRMRDNIHVLKVKGLRTSYENDLISANLVHLEPENKYAHLGKANLYELKVPGVKMKGINLRQAYRDRVVEVDSIQFNQPYMNFLLSAQRLPEKRRLAIDFKDLYGVMLQGSFKSVAIEDVLAKDGSAVLIQYRDDRLGAISSKNFNVEAKGFYIDQSAQMSRNNVLYTKDIDIQINEYRQSIGDSLHVLLADEIGISSSKSQIFTRNIHWKSLIPKDSLQLLEKAGKNRRLDLFIPKLTFDGVNFHDALVERKLHIDSVEISSPQADVIQIPGGPKAATGKLKSQADSLYGWLSPFFSSYDIGKVKISDGYLDYRVQQKDPKDWCFPEISGTFENFRIDSNSKADPNRMLYSDVAQMSMRGFKMKTPKKRWTLETAEIGFSTANNTLYIDSLDLVPFRSMMEFGPAVGKQIDWIDLGNKRLEFNDINLHNLVYNNHLDAGSLYIENLNLEVFRDKRLPFNIHQKPQMPQKLLREMPMTVTLDSFQVNNANIGYSEFAKEGRLPGRIGFDKLQIKGFNLTNDTSMLNKGLKTNIYADGFVMGKGYVKADFEFNLADSGEYHTYHAVMENMDLTEFNPLTENVLFLKIKKGQAQSIDFRVFANDTFAYGRMKFLYKNLRVLLIDKKTFTTTGFTPGVVSAAANIFVVNSNNPSYFIVRNGKIYFERFTNRSIFNYWAYTVFSGIKDSVGHKIVTKKPTRTSTFLDKTIKFRSISIDE